MFFGFLIRRSGVRIASGAFFWFGMVGHRSGLDQDKVPLELIVYVVVLEL